MLFDGTHQARGLPAHCDTQSFDRQSVRAQTKEMAMVIVIVTDLSEGALTPFSSHVQHVIGAWKCAEKCAVRARKAMETNQKLGMQ